MPTDDQTPTCQATLVVLAGGDSRRMGVDKLSLPLGESTVLGETLRHLSPHFGRTVIAGRRAIPPQAVRAVSAVDEQRGAGPLAGAIAGLEAAETELVALVGGDYVLLWPGLLDPLLTALGRAQVAIPRCAGRLQQMVVGLRREVLPVLRQAFAEGVRRPLLALQRAECAVVLLPPRCEAEGAFVNVNTWADYEALRAGGRLPLNAAARALSVAEEEGRAAGRWLRSWAG